MGIQKSLLAGGLTLAVLILPIIIIASREALRSVPSSIEQGAMALGATGEFTVGVIVEQAR
jgi:phosphate transport system permease protein